MPGPLRTKWRRPTKSNEDTIGPAIIFLGFFLASFKNPRDRKGDQFGIQGFNISIFQTSWSTRICETMARADAFFVERP